MQRLSISLFPILPVRRPEPAAHPVRTHRAWRVRTGWAWAWAWALAASAGPDQAGIGALRSPSEKDGGRVPLVGWAAGQGWEVREEGADRIELKRGGISWVFEGQARRARLGGVYVWLQYPPVRESGRGWTISRADIGTVLEPLLHAYRHVPPGRVRTVVLDPGHGGIDGGAVGLEGVLEKEVALDLAHRVRVRLEEEGIRVHLTREEDRTLSLEERVQLAEARHADLLVSIHLNGWKSGDVQGVETYVLAKEGHPSTNHLAAAGAFLQGAQVGNRHDGANAVLGYLLQRRMLERAQAVDRGLRHARFQVLRQAPCPAVLVECGYLTHPEEAARLQDPAYRDRLAQGLAEGILEYAREADKARLVSW